MQAFVSMMILTILAVSASATDQDLAPKSVGADPRDGTFPILGSIPLEMNVYCVGVGHDGTYFWVSAGDQATGQCEFYILDEYGNLVDNVPQGGGATGWGHRDLCWDGTYMYGSSSILVDAFGPDYMFAGSFEGCLDPNRALAFDGTYFYTAGFSEELTRMEVVGGAAICTYLGVWDGAYGLAYDSLADALYMSTANATGNLHCLTTAGALLNTYTTLPEYDHHGGCTMAATAQFGAILCVLMQAVPDALVFYDMDHNTPVVAESWSAIKAMFR